MLAPAVHLRYRWPRPAETRMTTMTRPDPKHTIGIDKAANQLVESARELMLGAGFELVGFTFDKDRHYVYELRGPQGVRYLFFDWYSSGSAWLSPTPWAEGTRCLQNAVSYDAASQSFMSADATTQVGEAFVLGLKEAFAKPLI
jgi:hypothetical protein